MVDIKIISGNNAWIKRQLPVSFSSINNCNFIFDDIQSKCDYCFVLDNVPHMIDVECPPNNLILCIGEPKSVKKYVPSFYKQFGRVASFYKFKNLENVNINIPLLPWMAGLRYNLEKKRWDDQNIIGFSELEKPINSYKLNKIAIISSNKAITLGHKRRLSFILFIKKHIPEYIDIFGNGFIPIEDKMDILSKYKYCLVIENSQFENYWTEKLADAYLSECYPIYIGSPNINEYFNTSEIKTIELIKNKSIISKISQIIENDEYHQHLKDIRLAKRKVLYQYNLLSQIADFVSKDFQNNIGSEITTIKPMNQTLIEKVVSFFSIKYYQMK